MNPIKNNHMQMQTSRQTQQFFVWSFLLFNLSVILYIWFDTSFDLLLTGLDGTWISLGRLFGLLAALCALLQFMLMSRAPWIERAFGLENIANFHRLNGYAVIILISLHPLALTIGYAAGNSLLQQYLTFLNEYEDVFKAFISVVLFFSVAATSIYIVRKRLKFETWYYVHLMVYAAVILAFGHQVTVGGSFANEAFYQYYWLALYGFVAINLLLWRFGLTFYNFMKYRFTVDHTIAETKDTTSLYITGDRLSRWTSIAGQYVLVRFLSKEMWTQEHPFSLSYIPKGNQIRLTVKAVGDYTQQIPHVKPGTPVLISGPFGVFTNAASQANKRLYIAGGVGITPIRSMLEEAAAQDSVLMYGNKAESDIIFKDELNRLTQSGHFVLHHILSADPNYSGERGYIDIARVERLVPDYQSRDIYICGPPVMMNALIQALQKAGVDEGRLYYERFSFHAQ
jgi:predicted ferric reductase